MKINNPVEKYKEKQREEAWERLIEKQRNKFKTNLNWLPEFWKEYPLLLKEVFNTEYIK